jgi:hypothetical protein
MESISLQTVKDELKRLLAVYQSESKEAQDTTDTFYWECAQDTIRDVAAAFNLPLEEFQERNNKESL